nr:GNAT family N-acetyltransferase [Candidatus Njordarchaeum guaymaensis]
MAGSRELNIPFADIFFPEEKLSCIVGRDTKFFLAVDQKGATGCCILATSPEPLRTEILFVHALRSEKEVLSVLLSEVLSILRSKRAPDIEAKYVDGAHSPLFKAILLENSFSETIKNRMFFEVAQVKKTKLPDGKIVVKNASSLLNWRALYISSTKGQSLEESNRLVHSETPYGTIEEDDLTRLMAYDGEQMVGTIGYSTCRNVAYLEKLGVLPSQSDRVGIAEVLVANAIRLAKRRNCDYVVMDADLDPAFRGILRDSGFKRVGQVHYFFRVITSKANLT